VKARAFSIRARQRRWLAVTTSPFLRAMRSAAVSSIVTRPPADPPRRSACRRHWSVRRRPAPPRADTAAAPATDGRPRSRGERRPSRSSAAGHPEPVIVADPARQLRAIHRGGGLRSAPAGAMSTARSVRPDTGVWPLRCSPAAPARRRRCMRRGTTRVPMPILQIPGDVSRVMTSVAPIDLVVAVTTGRVTRHGR
jgi:hypothetical protein